jgi:RHO protein GDP dissociation inhibitor
VSIKRTGHLHYVQSIPELYVSYNAGHLYELTSSTNSNSSSLCVVSNHQPIDQEDEALNRWKASLGLGSGTPIADPSDPRKCVIKSLALV